jgi:hypothetical protein
VETRAQLKLRRKDCSFDLSAAHTAGGCHRFRVGFQNSPALSRGDHAESSLSEDIVTAGRGVEIIPKEICVWVDRVDALRAGGHVRQRVLRGRGDDPIEKSKHVELNEPEVSANIEVVHDIEAGGQNLVIENACLGPGNRGRGRSIKPRNQSKWRKIGDDELGGSSIDKALDVDRLIDSCLDDVVR